MLKSKIQDVNERESVGPESSETIADNEGSNESEIKLKHEEETSNQLILEETCSTLLELLEKVVGINEIEGTGTEDKAKLDNSTTDACTQSTNESGDLFQSRNLLIIF